MAKYILVKHEAIRRGDHYDLRFEIPKSKNWASFAFNEMPPKKPGKRLYIVRTPDHSKENALFIGEIPECEYGAGIIKEVDSGDCTIIKYTNAHIIINFKGKVLKGTYHLINAGVFGRRRNFKRKVYAFFKSKKLVESYINYLYDAEKLIREAVVKTKIFNRKIWSDYI